MSIKKNNDSAYKLWLRKEVVVPLIVGIGIITILIVLWTKSSITPSVKNTPPTPANTIQAQVNAITNTAQGTQTVSDTLVIGEATTALISPTITSIQTLEGSTSASQAVSTPSAEAITLSGIEKGQVVPCDNDLTGSYTEDVTEPIWPIVVVDGIWYPQDTNLLSATKLNGIWNGEARFGDCNNLLRDAGKMFQLLIVRADEDCDQILDSYFSDGQDLGFWAGIPNNEASQSCGDSVEISISLIRE